MPFATGARITIEHRGERNLGGALLGALVPRRLRDVRRAAARRHAALPRAVAAGDADGRRRPASEPPAPRRGEPRRRGELRRRSKRRAPGQMVGLLLEINNVAGGWYGEGDDMVFVDGEAWPPAIHGTGTEEIFGGGACPAPSTPGRTTGSIWSRRRDWTRPRRRISLVRARSDPLHALAPLDGRARPREQLRERVRVGRVLVPDRAARAPSRALPDARRAAPAVAGDLRRGARARSSRRSTARSASAPRRPSTASQPSASRSTRAASPTRSPGCAPAEATAFARRARAGRGAG